MRSDEFWMHEALREAQVCLRGSSDSIDFASNVISDVPVGAICVLDDRIIGRGHNRREIDRDPAAHAEMLAMHAAAREVGNWRLQGVTLYVTLEPCPMCAGAIWLARPERVVFGAWDERAGACGSVFDIVRDPRLNYHPQVRGGVLQEECEALLTEFFAARRHGI